MKKNLGLLLVVLMVLSLSACSTAEPREESELSMEDQITQMESEDVSAPKTDEPDTDKPEPLTEMMETNQMKLQIGEHILTATLADNSSVEALKEMLKAGPITIDMQDYGSMEKVGSLGTSLHRNDEQVTTESGDLILYQGNAFVIYYAPNAWNFTRLGKINDVTQEDLKKMLGPADVKVTLSLD